MAYPRMHRYWSGVFGLSTEEFSQPGLRVVPHAVGLADYHGIYALEHGSSLAVSAPPVLLRTVEDRLTALGVAVHLAGLPPLLSDLLEQTVGPAYQGYLEPVDFRPHVAAQVRELTPTDTTFLDRLKEACEETAWSHSGLAVDDKDVYGCFVGGELVAAGKGILWSEDIANPGVVTHPAHRRHGYATAIVTAIVGRSLEQGHLVVYQTLLSNKAALGVAARLGFEEYGQSLALRLRADTEQS